MVRKKRSVTASKHIDKTINLQNQNSSLKSGNLLKNKKEIKSDGINSLRNHDISTSNVCSTSKIVKNNSEQKTTRSSAKKSQAVAQVAVQKTHSSCELPNENESRTTRSGKKYFHKLKTASTKSNSFEPKATRSSEEKNQAIRQVSHTTCESSNGIVPRATRYRKKNSHTIELVSTDPQQSSSRKSPEFEPKITRLKAKSFSANEHVLAKTQEKSSLVSVKRPEFVKLTNYDIDSIVLAKQKYSIAWPARILEIKKDKIRVYFFGDKREGFVNPSEIYDFKKSAEAVKAVISAKIKPRGYLTGIRETEMLLGIPEHCRIEN